MAKLVNLPAMPTAAEVITPNELTMAAMNKKDTLTIDSCKETGRPIFSSFNALSLYMWKLCSLKSKIKSRRVR